jgi:lathosterol oxidase
MCFNDMLATAAAAWPTIWLLDLLRYLLAASALAALLALGSRAWLALRSVRIRRVAAGQVRREVGWSLLTVLVFSLVGTSTLVGWHLGWSRIYTAADVHGWPWLVASLPVLIILHDTWFYWTHRLMHRPGVFRWSHRIHHQSMAPTPWAAYAFAPAEAFVQALFLPVVLLVLPMHQAVLFAWMLWMVARNVMGHAGTELLPARWLAGWWGRWMTTTLHHEMHHAHGHGNYGLYFTWWDQLCATEHREYRARLAQLIAGLRVERKLAAQSVVQETSP